MAPEHSGAEASAAPRETWAKVDVGEVEDLRDAVFGAGLEVTQYSRGHLSGMLAFRKVDGVDFTYTEIDGRVGLVGPLSRSRLTFGMALRMPEGNRQWLRPVGDGSLGFYLPDEHHEGIHEPGTRYITMALTRERLEQEAEALEVVPLKEYTTTCGLHPKRLPRPVMAHFLRRFQASVHGAAPGSGTEDLFRKSLQIAVEHLSRPPRRLVGSTGRGYAGIVSRAREYVHSHLCGPISIDDVARAAYTSRRSLYRAFNEILGETPGRYIRVVRLHRIRAGLADPVERAATVGRLAMRYGIPEHGRMSGWYRDLFGELPSETLRRDSRSDTRRKPS